MADVPTIDPTTDRLLKADLPTDTVYDADITALGLGTASTKNVPTSGDASATQVPLGNDSRLVNNAKSVGGGKEKVAALSASTGTCTGDLSAASIFTVTPTGNLTLAFSNIPAAATACTATVIVSQGATVRTVTMPSGTVWFGTAPTRGPATGRRRRPRPGAAPEARGFEAASPATSRQPLARPGRT